MNFGTPVVICRFIPAYSNFKTALMGSMASVFPDNANHIHDLLAEIDTISQLISLLGHNLSKTAGIVVLFGISRNTLVNLSNL